MVPLLQKKKFQLQMQLLTIFKKSDKDFRQIDVDGSGEITMLEFEEWWMVRL